MGEKSDTLRVLDDTAPDALTESDVAELKWLASQSRTVKKLFAVLIGAVSVLGVDKLIDLYSAHK